MKKKILSLSLALAMAAIAVVGGTMAYFTDTDAETNTFTVGNVSIDLIESQLHRVNAGVANDAVSTSPLWTDADMEGEAEAYEDDVTYWDGACFTDEQIKADAENYQAVYLADANIAPGTGYHKMPYVVNTGANDAYIRIRVIIPTELDKLLDDSMYTDSALEKEFTFEKTTKEENNVYTFTRVNPLAADEMTFWNVWGSVQMDKDVTNEDIEAMIEAELISEDGEFDVIVEADAIQADGFGSAAEAWAAFDNKAE